MYSTRTAYIGCYRISVCGPKCDAARNRWYQVKAHRNGQLVSMRTILGDAESDNVWANWVRVASVYTLVDDCGHRWFVRAINKRTRNAIGNGLADISDWRLT